MSDEIGNIKMRARRTPPSMLELCEYYQNKHTLTFGSKEHLDVEENQTRTATSKEQARLRKRLLVSAAASSSSYEPSESSSSGHMSVHKSRIFSAVREDVPSFLEEACTDLPRVRARKFKIVAVNGGKDGKDKYPSFHSPENTSNKSVQMPLWYTKTSNAKQDKGMVVHSGAMANVNVYGNLHERQRRQATTGVGCTGCTLPPIQPPTAVSPMSLPPVKPGPQNKLAASTGRRFGRLEIYQEPRSQENRRQGVCESKDGSGVERNFVRVLNKRF